jgi:ATP-binding cassette, subfamily B, bacterial
LRRTSPDGTPANSTLNASGSLAHLPALLALYPEAEISHYRLLIALLAEVGLRLLEPWPLKLIFDYVFGMASAESQPVFPIVTALDPMILLTLSVVLLVVIIGLRALMAYLSTIGFALAGNRVLAEVRRDLYRHLQRLSLSFHTKARGGDLVLRVIGDVGMLKEITVTAFCPWLAICSF